MIEAMIEALFILLDPYRLSMLFLGVIIGIGVGILPGLGGLMGMALLLPFLFGMDTYAGIALLVGVLAAVPSADTFPSVLMGIPGSSGSQATIMDGYPMTRKGQAARALSAAFLASMIGGLIGAVALSAVLPFARPIVLAFGAPELFMLTVLGLCVVGVLSGNRPLKGLVAAMAGLLVGAVGGAPVAPEYRYTFGSLYLFDGFSLVIVALGLFALPEIIDLLARGGSIARRADKGAAGTGWWDGIRDTMSHKWLVVRHSLFGVFLGFLPGVGSTITDWLNYGYVVQTSRDKENFGKGDVRGVIAPEAANNSREGGALIPTLLFGVPGNSAMALFLGAMLIFGLQPGPQLVARDLDLLFVIVWSLAIGNVLGTALCLVLSRPIAMLSYVPFVYVAPFVLLIVILGAYQESRHMADLVALLSFGVLGWFMKRSGMPRPPFLIGFILSGLAERYLWQAYSIYGWAWLMHWMVIVIAVIAVVLVVSGVMLKGSAQGKPQRPGKEDAP